MVEALDSRTEFGHLVCPDAKRLQDMRSEGIDERDVGRVLTARDHEGRPGQTLVGRWTAQFDAQLEVDRPTSPIEFVSRYIATVHSTQSAVDAKMAGLTFAYIQNPQNQRETRDWYRRILDRLLPTTAKAQAARVAFLALEGVLLMKLTGIDHPETDVSLLDGVEAILDRPQPADRPHRQIHNK